MKSTKNIRLLNVLSSKRKLKNKCLERYYICYWFYINNSDVITNYSGKPCKFNKDVYLTERHIKAALALAQISQLMPYYGGEITNEEWKNNKRKFTIVAYNGEIKPFTHVNNKVLIAFHTEQQRTEFMSFPENVQLIKDLYMVD